MLMDEWMDSQSVQKTDWQMDKAPDRVASLKLKDSIAYECVLRFATFLVTFYATLQPA